MKYFLFFFLFYCLLYSSEKKTLSRADFPVGKVVKKLRTEYLSLAIDYAQIVGGPWWEGSDEFKNGKGGKKAKPLNLQKDDLLYYAKKLSPFILRIGGSESDSVFYSFDGRKKTSDKFHSVMDKERWEDLSLFLSQTKSKLFLTFNAGPGNWDSKGKYNTDQWEHFLKFIQNRKEPIEAFEFGNENNAFWVNYGIFQQASTETYSKNFDIAEQKLKEFFPKLSLAGPANAYWPFLGEVLGFLTVDSSQFLKLKKDLSIFSWHYYPMQSKRCPIQTMKATKENALQLKTFKKVEKYMAEIKKNRDRHNPNAKIWLGETGPAQCGGEAGLSDQFYSSMWWLYQLGVGPYYDTDIQIRQSLIGSDYGLLNYKSFRPQPDYFASLLWKQNMGNRALHIENNNPNLQVFAHCHPTLKNRLTRLFLNFGSPLSYSLPEGGLLFSLGMDFEGNFILNNEKPPKRFNQLKAKKIESSQRIEFKKYSAHFVIEKQENVCN